MGGGCSFGEDLSCCHRYFCCEGNSLTCCKTARQSKPGVYSAWRNVSHSQKYLLCMLDVLKLVASFWYGDILWMAGFLWLQTVQLSTTRENAQRKFLVILELMGGWVFFSPTEKELYNIINSNQGREMIKLIKSEQFGELFDFTWIIKYTGSIMVSLPATFMRLKIGAIYFNFHLLL